MKGKSIYIAGHRGMVGKALVRAFQGLGEINLILRSRSELDLCNQQAVNEFFAQERPEVVVFAAAKVGGISANLNYPAEFIYENSMMASNAIHAAHLYGTQRFLFLGSTCIYPRLAPQPLTEGCLLTGLLEESNEPYAIAKIVGLKLCQYYRKQYNRLFHSAMPTNLYGSGDNYHPENSHVLPALIRRFHEAKVAGIDEVVIWGTGTPRRDFMHVNDLANALIHLLNMADPPNLVNVGTGSDISILDLARLIARIVGFGGSIKTDPTRPDGMPEKRIDMTRMHEAGWRAKIDLETGIKLAYNDFLEETQLGILREV